MRNQTLYSEFEDGFDEEAFLRNSVGLDDLDIETLKYIRLKGEAGKKWER